MTKLKQDILQAVREALDFKYWAYEDEADYEAGYKKVAAVIMKNLEKWRSAQVLENEEDTLDSGDEMR